MESQENSQPAGALHTSGLVAPLNRLGPAPWSECSTDEKLERLREELDGWRRECARLRDQLDLLKGHQHGSDGRILVNLDQAVNHGYSNAASVNRLR